ncbi:hypothetical protein PLICRDRAFT_42146 [Plicaturopsis crispa FD-325 SS-3]|nr:hypothetical protein PLICRDRAFT_42146 [Plicaturopsis crispa FD-325 SS-3]
MKIPSEPTVRGGVRNILLGTVIISAGFTSFWLMLKARQERLEDRDRRVPGSRPSC